MEAAPTHRQTSFSVWFGIFFFNFCFYSLLSGSFVCLHGSSLLSLTAASDWSFFSLWLPSKPFITEETCWAKGNLSLSNQEISPIAFTSALKESPSFRHFLLFIPHTFHTVAQTKIHSNIPPVHLCDTLLPLQRTGLRTITGTAPHSGTSHWRTTRAADFVTAQVSALAAVHFLMSHLKQ